MFSSLRLRSNRSLFVPLLLLSLLLKLEASSISYKHKGFIVITGGRYRQAVKMTSAPAAVAALESPVTDKQQETTIDKSKFRQTIESIKKEAAATTTSQSKKERKEETRAWRVVLYNDDIHSFTYVTESLASAIPQLSREVAHTLTVEAHNSGQATVLRTWKQKAEAYCLELQKRGLTVCSIHDSCPK